MTKGKIFILLKVVDAIHQMAELNFLSVSVGDALYLQ